MKDPTVKCPACGAPIFVVMTQKDANGFKTWIADGRPFKLRCKCGKCKNQISVA